MRVVFDDITNFVVEEVLERVQGDGYFVQCRQTVSTNFDFVSSTQDFYMNHPNGFINKVDIYDDDNTLISTLNNLYQVENINKTYKSKNDIYFIIELRLRSDLTPENSPEEEVEQ